MKVNGYEGRKRFDEEKVEDLGDCIRSDGIVEAIVLRKRMNGY
ncbi:ParB N-terminal domain-containing protein [Staphylococcus hominis]